MTTKGAMPTRARMLQATVSRPRALDSSWRRLAWVSSSWGAARQAAVAACYAV